MLKVCLKKYRSDIKWKEFKVNCIEFGLII